MGLLEEMMGEIGAAAGSAGTPAGAEHAAVTHAVLGMMHGGQGGLDLGSLTSAFAQGGLGHIVQSWISTGPNQPASPAQIQQGLGADVVAQIAAKAGVSPQVASQILSVVLPVIVNKLTPQGQVPAQSDLGGLLGGLLAGAGGAGQGGGLGGLLGGLLK